MSHHQDLNIALLVDQKESLGELIKKLKSSAIVIPPASSENQIGSEFELKIEPRVRMAEQTL